MRSARWASRITSANSFIRAKRTKRAEPRPQEAGLTRVPSTDSGRRICTALGLEQFAAEEGLAAGVWCGDEFAGTVGTHKINWLNVASACRSLIDRAFEQWGLNRVEIHCATTNKKSCSVAERLGFQWEGVLRKAQLVGIRYLDLNVYGILAREWKLRSR